MGEKSRLTLVMMLLLRVKRVCCTLDPPRKRSKMVPINLKRVVRRSEKWKLWYSTTMTEFVVLGRKHSFLVIHHGKKVKRITIVKCFTHI